MMRRIAIGFLWAIGGYLIGAFGGGCVVSVLSSNQHDASVEAATTGAFVLGPLGAIVGFAIGMIRSSARRATSASS
ncbi:MAG: hypothetical protein ABJA98_27255 [Acidobacteriota bacterium]